MVKEDERSLLKGNISFKNVEMSFKKVKIGFKEVKIHFSKVKIGSEWLNKL